MPISLRPLLTIIKEFNEEIRHDIGTGSYEIVQDEENEGLIDS